LSSRISLYSKILLMVCIHSKKSSGSSLPSNSRMSTLKSLKLVGRLLPLLGCLGESPSLEEPPVWGSSSPSLSSSPSRAEPGGLEEEELLALSSFVSRRRLVASSSSYFDWPFRHFGWQSLHCELISAQNSSSRPQIFLPKLC